MRLLYSFVIGSMLITGIAEGGSRGKRDSENTIALREALQDIQYEFSNHEEEIRMLEAKIENQQIELETLRGLVRDANQKSKGTSAVEKRVSKAETGLKSAANDLKKLQKHANKTGATLSALDTKVNHLEKQFEAMQSGMNAIMKALDIEVKSPIAKYRVKSGDTLGEIAQKHKTTIKAIKEYNNLKKSTIYVGQLLEIPTKG